MRQRWPWLPIRSTQTSGSLDSCCLRSGGRFPDSEKVGPDFLPLVDLQSMRFEQGSDAERVCPPDDILQNWHEDAQGVIAQDRPLRDRGKELAFGDRNGVTLEPIHVQHRVDVGAPVTHVYDVVGTYVQCRLQVGQHGYLPIARGDPVDRLDLSRRRVIVEAGPEDVIGRKNALQG